VPARHRDLVEAIRKAALDAPGKLDLAVRRAAATADGEVPAPVAAYVDKVRRHAYKVTDDDIAALKKAGYSEDQIFELTVGVAVGACVRRYDAAMAALEGGKP
jgi:alkylhydroperoxidase family enzyme